MMSSLVVDASVAVKWFVVEERSKDAVALTADYHLLAPALVTIEVASALSRKARQKMITVESAAQHMAALPRYFGEMVDHDTLLPAALGLSFELSHPIYDCVYLELARRRHVPMITDDLAFCAKATGSGFGLHVVRLSEWTTALR